MSEPFRVLFVCTGNVCRSPMAQAMLTHGLRERLGPAASSFVVASAGTGALAGEPMEEFATATLADLGIEPDEFVARDLDEDMLADADLVLTATKQHRSAVVLALPSVVRRAFTIKEFARLAGSLSLNEIAAAAQGDDDPDRVRAVVERVAGQRGLLPPVPQHEDDVADPYQQPAKRFAQTAAHLSPAVDCVTELIATVVMGPAAPDAEDANAADANPDAAADADAKGAADVPHGV